MKKPFFRVFDLVRHKLGCTATENGQALEVIDIETGDEPCHEKTNILHMRKQRCRSASQ